MRCRLAVLDRMPRVFIGRPAGEWLEDKDVVCKGGSVKRFGICCGGLAGGEEGNGGNGYLGYWSDGVRVRSNRLSLCLVMR